MRRRIALLAVVGTVTAAIGCLPPRGGKVERMEDTKPVALYWTTSRDVDRLDLAHMGASLRARHPGEEARAIAAWRYVRRTMFHYPMRNESHTDKFDAAKLVNVYGYSFCTQQGVTAAALAKAAGLKSRVIGVPGHGMYEVQYGGGWHAFCTTSGFFVRTRAEDRHIASMDEMKADPTLVTKARVEGRAGEPFLPCAGGPEILGEKEGTKECPYALTYRHYDEKFFVAGAKKWKSLGAPNPSRHAVWVPLRRGESLRLEWAAAETYVPPKIAERFWPPRHLCGAKDKANPFFPELAPYGRKVKGRVTYRYPGRGVHVWRPRLEGSGALASLAVAENVRASRGSLAPLDASKPAVAEFEVTGPYVYVDGAVEGTTHLGEGGSLRLLFRGTDPDVPWEEIHSAARGERALNIRLGERVQPTRPADKKKARAYTRYRFRVRVEMRGEAALSEFVLRGRVQHNWCALPQLVPGRNEIELRVKEKRVPPGASFALAWDERGQVRILRRRVRKTREHIAVRVKSAAMPRMRSVTFTRE